MEGFDVALYNKTRKMSMANESNVNRQQDNRLALQLQQIERNKETALRRISTSIELPKIQLSPRNESLQEDESDMSTLHSRTSPGRVSSFDSLKRWGRVVTCRRDLTQ